MLSRSHAKIKPQLQSVVALQCLDVLVCVLDPAALCRRFHGFGAGPAFAVRRRLLWTITVMSQQAS